MRKIGEIERLFQYLSPTNKVMRHLVLLSVLLLILASCSSLPDERDFDFFLNDPCMISNLEQNNLIEGSHFRVTRLDEKNSFIMLDLPDDFFLNASNCNNWTVGWGMDKPYYDAGVENIREITSIDLTSGTITLGTCKRGSGFPRVGQRIVFWNTTPSGYEKVTSAPVIHPGFWPDFHGQSIGFSSIVFDKYRQIWITLVYEVDSDKTQIYAAISTDMIHWRAARKGKPVLIGDDFSKCSWTSNKRTPRVSEIIHHEGKYYLFMDGEDRLGKRHIGMATAIDLLGEYTIYQKPLLSPEPSTWNESSVFCAKVAKRKNDFIMFYDGRDDSGYEQIGRATSSNLLTWEVDAQPALDQHSGWRSASFTTEPCHIEVHGDTVLLIAAGAKRFQEGYWHRHITHRSYLDKSGNVNDAQLGAFISIDGGKSFQTHPNNPVFVNKYTDPFENEHMGGNFERIEQDSTSYIFYQAKSSFDGMKYSIFLRKKPY